MKPAIWGVSQANMFEYQWLAQKIGEKPRYNGEEDITELQQPPEEKPIFSYCSAIEYAYTRAHWEHGRLGKAVVKANGPPSWVDQPQDTMDDAIDRFVSSGQFDNDFRRRTTSATGVWLGIDKEALLVAPVPAYLYATAGALAIHNAWGNESFRGNDMRSLLVQQALSGTEAEDVRRLLIGHGVLAYDPAAGFGAPNAISSPLHLVPEALEYIANHDVYDRPPGPA